MSSSERQAGFSVIYTLLKVHEPFQYQLPELLHTVGY